MPSLVQPMPSGDLPSWPTKRLLGLRDRLLQCEESVELSDVQKLDEFDPSVVRFKDDPRWSELYEAVRGILSTREHVPGSAERGLRRRERANTGRARDRKTPPKPRGR